MTTTQQFIRFCLVGGGGLLINISITYFGVMVLGWWYFWAYLLATLISWSLMFGANALFAFPNHHLESYPERYATFMLGYGVIFCINAVLVYALTSYVGIYYLWSIVVATAITTILTFIFSKHVIYKP